MQELIDMLRIMGGSCRAIIKQHPTAFTQAAQYVVRGSLPGIRIGIPGGLMVRIVIEKENNDANKVATAAEADAWNSLWVDPSKERDAF